MLQACDTDSVSRQKKARISVQLQWVTSCLLYSPLQGAEADHSHFSRSTRRSRSERQRETLPMSKQPGGHGQQSAFWIKHRLSRLSGQSALCSAVSAGQDAGRGYHAGGIESRAVCFCYDGYGNAGISWDRAFAVGPA